MNAVTQFAEPLAVEAWDAWFRWREHGELRDLTIDATWNRVADAIAGVEGAAAAGWAQRFADAFADWQLLPDERLLCNVGTGAPLNLEGSPGAVLNVAAFVRTPTGALPRLDRDRLLAAAALAVRLLDDALLADTGPRPAAGLRIGLIGLADALARLGLRYDSEPARQQAREIAAALAEGCLQGAIALAAERGPSDREGRGLALRWRARDMPPGLIADGLHWGVRHVRLTAISSQPRLALFANAVADALDPMIGPRLIGRDAALDDLPFPRAADAAIRRPGQRVAAGPIDTLADVPARAQIELRAAVQPWIDAPIDYPLAAPREPDRDTRAQCAALASHHGLPAPCWQAIGDAAPPSRV